MKHGILLHLFWFCFYIILAHFLLGILLSYSFIVNETLLNITLLNREILILVYCIF